MKKINFIIFLFPSLLYSQINSDYKEIAKQKIKAVNIGDTTLEDYEVLLYDTEGWFREKLTFSDYVLTESMKFDKDGISWEELNLCCKEWRSHPVRCVKTDTCSFRKIKYDEKLRLVNLVEQDFQEDWGERYEAFEKSCFKNKTTA